jgi:hypothetical protein
MDSRKWRIQGGGGANGQLFISFGDLSIEILLFQNCLFSFELGSNHFFLPSEFHIHLSLVLSAKN